jgi:hypothetical protein
MLHRNEPTLCVGLEGFLALHVSAKAFYVLLDEPFANPILCFETNR